MLISVTEIRDDWCGGTCFTAISFWQTLSVIHTATTCPPCLPCLPYQQALTSPETFPFPASLALRTSWRVGTWPNLGQWDRKGEHRSEDSEGFSSLTPGDILENTYVPSHWPDLCLRARLEMQMPSCNTGVKPEKLLVCRGWWSQRVEWGWLLAEAAELPSFTLQLSFSELLLPYKI